MRLPLVGGGPGGVALLGERVGRRAEAEHVEQHGLVVALPAVGQEAALRRPAVRDGRPAALRPAPVHAAVERVGQRADLVLVGRVAIEVGGGGQHARQEERRVDGRELAPPGATARLHVEEVVVEPPVAGGVGLRPLRAVAEEPQPGEHHPGDLVAREQPSLDEERRRRQRHPDRGDAGRRPLRGLVRDQPVLAVDLVEVILEGHPLQGGEIAVAADADFVQVDAPRSSRLAEVVPTSKGPPVGRDRPKPRSG